MFTVTSVPPNVMLMFDDSASMQLLSLKSPPYYSAPTNPRTHGGNPLLKLNTAGLLRDQRHRLVHGLGGH